MICTCRDPMALGVVHRADAPCYHPEPKREWQGLTEEEVRESIDPFDEPFSQRSFFYFAEVIEAKLKEKNT